MRGGTRAGDRRLRGENFLCANPPSPPSTGSGQAPSQGGRLLVRGQAQIARRQPSPHEESGVRRSGCDTSPNKLVQ